MRNPRRTGSHVDRRIGLLAAAAVALVPVIASAAPSIHPLASLGSSGPSISVAEAAIEGRWPGLDAAKMQQLVREGMDGIDGYDLRTGAAVKCSDEKCWRDAAEQQSVTHFLITTARFVDNDSEIRLEVYEGRSGALVASVESSCEVCANNEVREILTATSGQLRRRLEDLQDRDGALVIEGTPNGAEVIVDGKVVGQTPYRGSVSPGPHSIVIASEGYRPHKVNGYVEPGETTVIEADLRGRGPRSPRKDRGPLRAVGWAGIGTMVAGAALIGTGAALLAIDGDPVDSSCPGGMRDINGRCPQMYETRVSGIATLAVGSAALVGGAILIALDRTRARKTTVALGWRGITVSGQF